MKFNVKKQILIILSLALVVFSSVIVEAQTKQLAETDKAQIIATILKKQKLKDPEYSAPDAEETVYLLENNISAEQLPQIKNIKFVLITDNQVNEMKKNGVEYYSFSEFEFTGKTIEVTFSRKYIHYGKYAAGNSTYYECRKVSGRWKVRGGKPSVWVAENN
jgi:hypothetical protein